jgi:hypothetical protein
MHVATTRRQHKDKVYETHLLRRSYREDGKVKNETHANLSHLPPETLALIRESLAGKSHVLADEAFTIERSLRHGDVALIVAMAKSLGLEKLLGPPCPERDLALALIVARCCAPSSKLATTRWWTDTSLVGDLVADGTGTDEAYAAMDWLVSRQASIEASLARRHLTKGAMVLYDLSSSWVEGSHCPLAARGYSRDHKGGKAQIEYGLMTDADGRPVSVEVFSGNTADPSAFVSAVERVRTRFKLEEVILVGDRGMITSARIEALASLGGLSWITCLRAPQIRLLAEHGAIQLSLFDETNLCEISHPDYENERLIACRNPALAGERARKRTELLAATEVALDKIVAAVSREQRPLRGTEAIAMRVAKVLNRYKMAKHFATEIGEETFAYRRKTAEIEAEAALDGIYVIRTNVAAERLDAPGAVTAYKGLAVVERDFRNMKAIDLDLRPIYHYTEDRVRAHVLVCMLAAYVLWHLRKALAPLCFTDEHAPSRDDPVKAATRSDSARAKDASKTNAAGESVQSFSSLLAHLGTLTRNTVVFAGGVRIDKLSVPTPLQRRAFELVGAPIPTRLKAT